MYLGQYVAGETHPQRGRILNRLCLPFLKAGPLGLCAVVETLQEAGVRDVTEAGDTDPLTPPSFGHDVFSSLS